MIETEHEQAPPLKARGKSEADHWLEGYYAAWNGKPSKPPKRPDFAQAYAEGYKAGSESRKNLTHD